MKCPMFVRMWTDGYGQNQIEVMDCLKEECAWWEKEAEGCAFPLLALRLSSTIDVLEAIKRRMPKDLALR